MKTPPLERLVDRLCDLSTRAFSNPFEGLEWPDSLPEDAWYFSPELVSVAGLSQWDALDERGRKKLSFFEAVNFFSLNVHGEKALLEGLSHRLYRRQDAAWTRYLHHFLDEENKHMVYFGTFCTRYAGGVYPDRKMETERSYDPGEEDLLFFARVLVFEELVDTYNLRMAEDDRLHPLVREINRMHHLDESRHLAFGRRLVHEMFVQRAQEWPAETQTRVREYLAGYLESTWREYHNPTAYRDAGLAEPYALQREALASPADRERLAEATRQCRRVLGRAGLLLEARAE